MHGAIAALFATTLYRALLAQETVVVPLARALAACFLDLMACPVMDPVTITVFRRPDCGSGYFRIPDTEVWLVNGVGEEVEDWEEEDFLPLHSDDIGFYDRREPVVETHILPRATVLQMVTRALKSAECLMARINSLEDLEHFYEPWMTDVVVAWHEWLIKGAALFVKLRQRAAVRKIQRAFRKASGDPVHPMCQRRLQREYGELVSA
jgi:hypothetical protein